MPRPGWSPITTRIAIDRLRAAKVQREHYAGIWLPEPGLDRSPAHARRDQGARRRRSVAFLFMLERLAPEARAAFLLREVFDADYDEVAEAIGKSEAACRQLVTAQGRSCATRARASRSRATPTAS